MMGNEERAFWLLPPHLLQTTSLRGAWWRTTLEGIPVRQAFSRTFVYLTSQVGWRVCYCFFLRIMEPSEK
jgi:hypothetical protein